MSIVLIVLFAFLAFVIENHYIHEKRKAIMKEVEHAFLLAGLSHEQYRHHILQLLEIVYDKAAETDEQYKKDYDNIKKKADEKFNQFSDEYILKLKNVLGYETAYNNWEEATKYIEGLVKKNKQGDEKSFDYDDR